MAPGRSQAGMDAGVPVPVLASSMLGCGLNTGPLLGEAGTLPTKARAGSAPPPLTPGPRCPPATAGSASTGPGPAAGTCPPLGPEAPRAPDFTTSPSPDLASWPLSLQDSTPLLADRATLPPRRELPIGSGASAGPVSSKFPARWPRLPQTAAAAPWSLLRLLRSPSRPPPGAPHAHPHQETKRPPFPSLSARFPPPGLYPASASPWMPRPFPPTCLLFSDDINSKSRREP